MVTAPSMPRPRRSPRDAGFCGSGDIPTSGRLNAVARGSLRIYLGASPGVGKTYRMLGEGVRRKERGTDVVIGMVVTHGRAQTAAQIRDLEIIPPKEVAYRGTTLLEMDVDAILARRPKVVL